jgi:hypothetical protein
MLGCAPIGTEASACPKCLGIKVNSVLMATGRVMAEDVCYEIQVRKNGNWVPLGLVATPQQAEQEARAALAERRYLEAYKIVCERRDGRTGKPNKVAFAPVMREDLEAAADDQWLRHVQGRPAVDRKPSKSRAAAKRFSWLLPVAAFLAIMWGAYFTLVFLRAQILGQ